MNTTFTATRKSDAAIASVAVCALKVSSFAGLFNSYYYYFSKDNS